MNRLPNFGGYTPSDLQNMGFSHLLYLALTVGRSVNPAEPPDPIGAEPPPFPQYAVPVSAGPPNPERLTLTPPSPLTRRGLGEGELPASRIQEPASASLALTPQFGVPPSGGPFGARLKSRRRPRSKAFHLPPDIQLSLNTMLANGRPYAEIIRCLNDHGYPGFNKVNLHNWKTTGYQAWVRCRIEPPKREDPSGKTNYSSDRKIEMRRARN